VPRKIAILLCALLVPGGLVALCGAWLVKTLRSERGRKALASARSRVPAWAGALRAPVISSRQTA
jgi:hypothetical protein